MGGPWKRKLAGEPQKGKKAKRQKGKKAKRQKGKKAPKRKNKMGRRSSRTVSSDPGATQSGVEWVADEVSRVAGGTAAVYGKVA
jgi:hypothetical protein